MDFREIQVKPKDLFEFYNGRDRSRSLGARLAEIVREKLFGEAASKEKSSDDLPKEEADADLEKQNKEA